MPNKPSAGVVRPSVYAATRPPAAREHLPGYRCHSQECAYAAEDESYNPSGRETRRQWSWTRILPREVQHVHRVPSCVAGCRYTCSPTHIVMILRHHKILLNLKRGFDHRRSQASNKVPINMTVEQPDA
jgi:hypothetical protein